MNDGSYSRNIIKSVGPSILLWLGLAVISQLSYVALQFVSRPYWQLGTKVSAGGGEEFQTLFVVNPGPWRPRNPIVEFSLGDGVRVVGWSSGVSVDRKLNKQYASYDNGLPPGCFYFITYEFTHGTNDDPQPAVVCDGKPCKNAPTFDNDVMLKILLAFEEICVLVAFLMIGLYIQARNALRKEKDNTVNKALDLFFEERLSEKERASDVNESVKTLNLTLQKIQKGEIPINAQPVNKRKGVGHVQTFSVHAPNAMKVQLLGDFTDWQERPINFHKDVNVSGVWRAMVNLEPGKYHYRFLVDGKWQDDPECVSREPNNYGGEDMIRLVK